MSSENRFLNLDRLNQYSQEITDKLTGRLLYVDTLPIIPTGETTRSDWEDIRDIKFPVIKGDTYLLTGEEGQEITVGTETFKVGDYVFATATINDTTTAVTVQVLGSGNVTPDRKTILDKDIETGIAAKLHTAVGGYFELDGTEKECEGDRTLTISTDGILQVSNQYLINYVYPDITSFLTTGSTIRLIATKTADPSVIKAITVSFVSKTSSNVSIFSDGTNKLEIFDLNTNIGYSMWWYDSDFITSDEYTLKAVFIHNNAYHPLESKYLNIDNITIINEEGISGQETGLLHAKSAIEITAFPSSPLTETIYRLTEDITNYDAGLYVYDKTTSTWIPVGNTEVDEKTILDVDNFGDATPLYTQIGGYKTDTRKQKKISGTVVTAGQAFDDTAYSDGGAGSLWLSGSSFAEVKLNLADGTTATEILYCVSNTRMQNIKTGSYIYYDRDGTGYTTYCIKNTALAVGDDVTATINICEADSETIYPIDTNYINIDDKTIVEEYANRSDNPYLKTQLGGYYSDTSWLSWSGGAFTSFYISVDSSLGDNVVAYGCTADHVYNGTVYERLISNCSKVKIELYSDASYTNLIDTSYHLYKYSASDETSNNMSFYLIEDENHFTLNNSYSLMVPINPKQSASAYIYYRIKGVRLSSMPVYPKFYIQYGTKNTADSSLINVDDKTVKNDTFDSSNKSTLSTAVGGWLEKESLSKSIYISGITKTETTLLSYDTTLSSFNYQTEIKNANIDTEGTTVSFQIYDNNNYLRYYFNDWTYIGLPSPAPASDGARFALLYPGSTSSYISYIDFYTEDGTTTKLKLYIRDNTFVDGNTYRLESVKFSRRDKDTYHPIESNYINVDDITIVNDETDTTAETGTLHAKSAIEIDAFPTSPLTETMYRLTADITGYAAGLYVYDSTTSTWISVGGSQVDEKTIRSKDTDNNSAPLHTQIGGWKDEIYTTLTGATWDTWEDRGTGIYMAHSTEMEITTKALSDITNLNLRKSYFYVDFINETTSTLSDTLRFVFDSSGTGTYTAQCINGTYIGSEPIGGVTFTDVTTTGFKYTVHRFYTDKYNTDTWTINVRMHIDATDVSYIDNEFVKTDNASITVNPYTNELESHVIPITTFPEHYIHQNTIYRLLNQVTISGVTYEAGLYYYDANNYAWIGVGGTVDVDGKTILNTDKTGAKSALHTKIGGWKDYTYTIEKTDGDIQTYVDPYTLVYTGNINVTGVLTDIQDIDVGNYFNVHMNNKTYSEFSETHRLAIISKTDTTVDAADRSYTKVYDNNSYLTSIHIDYTNADFTYQFGGYVDGQHDTDTWEIVIEFQKKNSDVHYIENEYVNKDNLTLILNNETGGLEARSCIDIAAFPTINIHPETVYRLLNDITVAGETWYAGLYVYDITDSSNPKWVLVSTVAKITSEDINNLAFDY